MRICNTHGGNGPAYLLVCFVGTSLVAPLLDRAIATGGQNMRTRFLTLIAAVGLGAALLQYASAADLSMPPIYRGPPPAYFTWTGWDVGLNGGGGWGPPKT